MAFPDPQTIAQVQGMPVRARLIVDGALSGMHRASIHGSSIEFSQHKEYSPGDEIRHIDWKAYGKVDRYYVKQYEQESQLTSLLVLDASGSMAYAGRGLSKLAYGAHLLAALAYLLIGQRDKVGLHVLGDTERDPHYIPPRARPAHLRDLLAALEEVDGRGARGAEPLASALDRVAEQLGRRRALVVIASDLFDSDPRVLASLRQLAAQGSDVALLHVLDRDELDFPFEGLTQFESLESEHRMLVNPAAVRREYKQRMEAFLTRVRETCVDGRIDYQLTVTDRPFEHSLREFLELRSRVAANPRIWTS